MRTYNAKVGESGGAWTLIDAEGLVPGRLAALVATRLRGKHRAEYTPHIDCGDYVVIVNAAKIEFTADKARTKTYYRHTGYPGGIRSTTAREILSGKTPERALELAVRRMMPKGPLARRQLSKLRIYAGDEHPHGGRQPEALDVAGLNPKNAAARSRRGDE